MSRQPLIHRSADQSTPSASVSIARTRLFVVDVDRKKRIDDSCGEALLDALLDADRVLRERGGATVVHQHRPDRATKVR